jgi:hypothetical protein
MSRSLFDPARDPFADASAAMERAQREKKNVLFELGGDWCIWCQRLESFIHDHPELEQIRARCYITVKVYLSQSDETNFAFIRKLPPFDGVPHLYVYNARGQLLHSQDTAELEEGESYNYERVKDFLTRWSDARLTPYDALSTEELRRRFGRRLHSPDDGPISAA